RYAFRLTRRIDFSRIDAVRQPPKTPAFLTVAAHQFDFARTLQVGYARKAVAGKTRGADCAHAEYETHRFCGQKGRRISRAKHGKAPRFVEVGCHLGQKLVA